MWAPAIRNTYGTRAAADGWHTEYSHTLEAMEFLRGDASACVFKRIARSLVASVHGDDFTVCGPKKHFDRLGDEMRKKYELTEMAALGQARATTKR